jgi:hypothetical protein
LAARPAPLRGAVTWAAWPAPPRPAAESFYNVPVNSVLPRLLLRPISFAVSSALQLSEGVWGAALDDTPELGPERPLMKA